MSDQLEKISFKIKSLIKNWIQTLLLDFCLKLFLFILFKDIQFFGQLSMAHFAIPSCNFQPLRVQNGQSVDGFKREQSRDSGRSTFGTKLSLVSWTICFGLEPI